MSCCYQFRDKDKKCSQPAVKGSNLCRRHRYNTKNSSKPYNIIDESKRTIRPTDKTADDVISLCSFPSIADNVAEIQSVHTDDTIDITRQFIFDCIDEYFEKHHKRDKWIKGKDSTSDKKKGGMDLNTILGIAGVSLMPLLTKMMKDNGGGLGQLFGQKDKEPNIDARYKQSDPISVERPTRQQAEDLPTERKDNVNNYQKT